MGIFKNSGSAVECLLGTLSRTPSSDLDFALSHIGYSHGLGLGLRGEGTGVRNSTLLGSWRQIWAIVPVMVLKNCLVSVYERIS